MCIRDRMLPPWLPPSGPLGSGSGLDFAGSACASSKLAGALGRSLPKTWMRPAGRTTSGSA
eukprot:9777695-Alexandrium_andersonii.AAC.1